jgi:aryl-alcohol dehydrogenase-like predicted oxidoreductase
MGTLAYAQRFSSLAPDHFRQRYGLYLSSVGLGTYLGDAGEEASRAYRAAVKEAVARGCNVLDTAVNYRFMQSERDLGQAVGEMIDAGQVRREELVICSKGGYVPFASPAEATTDPVRSIQDRFYATGITEPMQLVGNQHCMAPAYLDDQIGVSLANLGLETIDVYYLHNPETQLHYVTPDEFRKRLHAAFAHLEGEVQRGRIRFYGIATWDGLRTDQRDRAYLPLSLFVEIAHQVGGDQHHFRFVQFPYNLTMLEAVLDSNQTVESQLPTQAGGSVGQRVTLPLIAAARQSALVAVASATLAQGQILGNLHGPLREVLGSWQSDAQYAIQFNRSTPGLTTTLVGMGSPAHVAENLAVTQQPGLDPQTFFDLFAQSSH